MCSLHCHIVNIPFLIILISYKSLVHRVGYAHLSLNHDILQLLKSHGNVPTTMKHWGKCSWWINIFISLELLIGRGMLPCTIFHPQNHLASKINRDDMMEDLDDDQDQNCLEMVEGNVVLTRSRSTYSSLFSVKFWSFTSSKISLIL